MKTIVDKEKNILYYLHESTVIDIKIKGNDLIFRVSINYYFKDEIFGRIYDGSGECEYEYLCDIICHNYSNLRIPTSNDEDAVSLVNNLDFYFAEIYCFSIYKNEYNFSLRKLNDDNLNIEYFFYFDCESVEWVPIKVVTIDELDIEDHSEFLIK